MSSFWAKFTEPLPNVPVTPNNASAIFGGHSPYGLRATEPSIFRPSKEKPKTRKPGRSNSDAGLLKASEKQKTKDSSSKRKLSESRLKGSSIQSSANNNRPLSPRSNEKESSGKASPIEQNTDENNLADSTDSSGSNGDRYPRFISVKKGATPAEVKPRKPSNELKNDKQSLTSEQPTEGKQRKIKRSSSFSTSRKPSESPTSSKSTQSIKPRGVCNPKTGVPTKVKSPLDSFRREKSDIIVRPRGTCSPSSPRKDNTILSNSRGVHSPSALKREKSDITPRRTQPGILRENSDLVRPRGSISPIALRREKSDIVIPRRSPGIGKRQKSDISLKAKTVNSATPNSSVDSISCTSQSESINKVVEHSMSKIPTPAGANPPSKIPSFTKTSTSSIPQTKIPPKSKLPSFGKADKKDEQSKKSQIPTGIPRSDKLVSKIPGPPRPDSAKENKDPVINRKESEEEPPKPVKNETKVSRIPSAKGAPTVSKIPRQDNQLKKSASEDDTDNVFGDEHEVVATEKVLSPQSRIPSLSSSNQASNIPTGLSKIPSLSKTNAQSKPITTTTPEKSEATSPGSKIPHGIGSVHTGIPSPTVHAKPETVHTGIPTPTVHAKTETAHTGIPPPKVHAKPETGIRKPETNVSGIPKLEVKTSTPVSGVLKPEVTTSPSSIESKIPQLSHTDSTPKSKIPGLPGSLLTRKLSEEKFKKTYEKPAEKTAEAPKEETIVNPSEESPPNDVCVSTSGGKVAPPPPPRQDVTKEETKNEEDDSPMDKFIFSEAKRMEELLRNESIVVEIPSKNTLENETQIAEKPKKLEELDELISKKGPEVQEMTTGVDKVCVENINEQTPKKELTKKEPVLFSTFGKKEDLVANEKAVPKETPKQDVKGKMEVKASTQEKAEELGERGVDAQSPVDETKTVPAIDTLGQYEQQTRRSRSRQRKVISPDSEQAETTFEQTASEDDTKKVVEKDKTGDQPFEGDETKDSQAKPDNNLAKVKSKHDKPKFVIESSLGADFYQSKTSQSKESLSDETAEKPSEVIVIQNKTFKETKADKPKDIGNNKKPRSKGKESSDAFEDVDLSSNRGSKTDMKAWSMEQLDEKTVKCACGRGGKCSIM